MRGQQIRVTAASALVFATSRAFMLWLLVLIVGVVAGTLGGIVGFGGRVLPQQENGTSGPRAKYRNSPESPFFNKRRLLYGLRQVKRAATR